MNFNLHIKNIGKLTDAKIRVGQFTVFAGPNNTGKSFVSQIVYSFFNAMNANHAEVHIINLTDSLLVTIVVLGQQSEDYETLLSPLRDNLHALHNLVMESPVGNVEELDKIIPDLVETANSMQTIFQENRIDTKLMAKEDGDFVKLAEGRLADGLEALKQSLRE